MTKDGEGYVSYGYGFVKKKFKFEFSETKYETIPYQVKKSKGNINKADVLKIFPLSMKN